MNIIITRALNMEFEEKDLAAKVFHGKKDKLLYILELSYKKYYNLLYNYGSLIPQHYYKIFFLST